MKHLSVYFFVAVLTWSCSTEQNIQYQDIEKALQAKFLMAEDGDVIKIEAGHFKFSNELWLDGRKNVTIKGAGIDKTFLSFKDQEEGAQGIKVTNGENIIIEDLTVQDTDGDAFKVQKVNKLIFRNTRAEWTGGPKEENGAYGFYPVDCDNVLLENCIAIAASDAGIYVGQSRDIIVKNCEAFDNVAGIEIENCIRADVFDNYAHGNTGGILIFDMPGLTQSGNGVRIYNNLVEKNNLFNFAPEGNIVGEVPPGTGVMVLATDNVEIFDNDITGNRTAGAIITSYLLVRKPHKDKTFDPYPKGISIFDNKFSTGFFQFPDTDNDIGKLLLAKFWLNLPDIIYDGYLDPEAVGPDGKYTTENKICIRNNGDINFVNVDAPNEFANISTELSEHDCSTTKLPEVTLSL